MSSDPEPSSGKIPNRGGWRTRSGPRSKVDRPPIEAVDPGTYARVVNETIAGWKDVRWGDFPALVKDRGVIGKAFRKSLREFDALPDDQKAKVLTMLVYDIGMPSPLEVGVAKGLSKLGTRIGPQVGKVRTRISPKVDTPGTRISPMVDTPGTRISPKVDEVGTRISPDRGPPTGDVGAEVERAFEGTLQRGRLRGVQAHSRAQAARPDIVGLESAQRISADAGRRALNVLGTKLAEHPAVLRARETAVEKVLAKHPELALSREGVIAKRGLFEQAQGPILARGFRTGPSPPRTPGSIGQDPRGRGECSHPFRIQRVRLRWAG